MTELTYLPTEHIWNLEDEWEEWVEFFNWYFSDNVDKDWVYYQFGF